MPEEPLVTVCDGGLGLRSKQRCNPQPPTPLARPVSGPFLLFFGEEKSTPGGDFTSQKTIDFLFFKNKSGEPIPIFCFEKNAAWLPKHSKPPGNGAISFFILKKMPPKGHIIFSK